MPQSDFPPAGAGTRRSLRLVLLAGAAIAAALAVRAAASFLPDEQPTGWISRPALTSYRLTSSTEVLYRPGYRAGGWSGALYANVVDAHGNVTSTTPWSNGNAAKLLDAQDWDTGRRIVTRNASGANVPFRWAQLSSGQQSSIGNSTDGPKLLNFVRGDRSNENPSGDKLRARTTVLGDIQQSTLLHWNHGGGKRRLYVGANDGMLHVFDAATGAEVFAYVPSMLMGRLKLLAKRPYAHALFVDGSLAMNDITVGSSTQTWLVGALGGGGQGLFMLDMTNPDAADETAAAAKIKWEITPASAGFANLGHTYAAPKFARLQNGTAAVIVGNGYNNGGNGRASLLVIDAASGALIREIDTGSGTTASPNGLSSPTLVDRDGDGKVDLVYAGDIDGNLWRFDLGASSPASFSVVKRMSTDPAQAITVAPVIAPHPAGGRIVLFGTGRMLASTDASNTAVHYVYGFWDGAPSANATWLTQTLTDTSSNGQLLRYASTNTPNWASGGHLGWKLALPAGARMVGEAPFVNDDRYYFVTLNPTTAPPSADQPSGSSWVYQLDYSTGGSPAASVLDVNEDETIDDGDRIDGQVIVGRQLGPGLYSQPVLVDLETRSQTMFNWNSGLADTVPIVSVPGNPGVSGGHFDVDLYHRASGTFRSALHVHEYDDKFDVTGVNFLNASNAGFNLSNAITSTATAFKVLVMNQYLNPAAKLSVGGADFVSVKTFGGLASATDAQVLLDSLPTYTRATIGTLAFKLPMDGFKTKDWWGDGGTPRTGLIPTQTGCVNKVAASGVTATLGPNGERHDGALTIQLIAANTPASALELNFPAGGPKYGWRVKTPTEFKYVLAEYTTFWHHPNGKCYGALGWVANAPEDTSTSSTRQVTRASGSTDPNEGVFTATVPSGVTVTSTTTTVSGDTTSTVTLYSDGKRATVTVQINGDGSETVTTTNRDGQSQVLLRGTGNRVVSGAEEALNGTRRLSWREIVRP